MAPAAAASPGHRPRRPSIPVAEGAQSDPTERPTLRAKVDGRSRYSPVNTCLLSPFEHAL